MKRTLALLLLLPLLSFAPSDARAATGDVGLGVIVGEPTGLSLKIGIDERHAVAAALAWSFAGNSSAQVHADYLVYPGSRLERPSLNGRAPFYYGVGGRLRLEEDKSDRRGNHDAHLGVRVPLGISFYPSASPQIEFFAEIAPGMDLLPATTLFLNAGAGVRFLFR